MLEQRRFAIDRREAGCEEVILSMDGSWCPAVDTDETDTEGTAEEKAQNACLVIALSCTAYSSSKRETYVYVLHLYMYMCTCLYNSTNIYDTYIQAGLSR